MKRSNAAGGTYVRPVSRSEFRPASQPYTPEELEAASKVNPWQLQKDEFENPSPPRSIPMQLPAVAVLTTCLLLACGPADPAGQSTQALTSPAPSMGVNLSGAEVGSGFIYGTNYIYPTNAEYDYFTKKGIRLYRLPVLWERVQRALNGPLDAAELSRLDNAVYQATSRGADIIIDIHNYARYNGNVIGSAAVPNPAYADIWRKLAKHYASNPRVWFDLMNEPHGMPTEQWRSAAQAAINAIRGIGVPNRILVEGNGFSSANFWMLDTYGESNGVKMAQIYDPLSNVVFSPHQYADVDGSGTHASCKSTTIYSVRLAAFTAWARTHGYKAILGEWGVAQDANCLATELDLLNYIQANSDVWIGAAYFAAGPWWGSWFMSLEPDFSTAPARDKPQMNVMEPFIGPVP